MNWNEQRNMTVDTRKNRRLSLTFGILFTVYHWNRRKSYWNSQLVWRLSRITIAIESNRSIFEHS